MKNSDVGEHASVQLKQVLILDDFSNSPVSTWSEWSQLTEAQRKTVKFLRSSSSRKGYVVAKSNAVKFLQDKIDASIVRDKIMLIFLDKLSIVSPNWLQPLASSLDKYSNALVYPAVDVLVEGKAANKKFEVIRADDMVAGFTWSFLPRWESVSDSNRLKFATNLDEESSSIEVFSPAVPSVFAIALDHFLLMEGFDQTLHASEYAQENVDLSIRTWLCGGSVIQQTCSRVAQPFNNLLQDGHVGVEVRQRDIDSNVMNMAQRYLSLPVFNDVSGDNVAGFKNVHNLHRQAGFTYRELAFQSRFKDRVPYTVDTSIDPVRSGPVQSSLFPGESVIGTKGNNQGTFCTNFMWLVQEVYPALSQDIESTLKSYHNAHNRPDSVSQRALSKMIDEIYHLKPIEVSKGASLTLASREDFLNAQAGYVLGMQQSQDFKIKHHFTPPKEVAKPKEPQLVDMLEIHARDVRETLECTDFEDYRKGASHIDHYCAGITSNGDPGVCRTMKAKLLFNCPKSCGFCDGDNFCEDFFLNKCKFSFPFFFPFYSPGSYMF